MPSRKNDRDRRRTAASVSPPVVVEPALRTPANVSGSKIRLGVLLSALAVLVAVAAHVGSTQIWRASILKAMDSRRLQDAEWLIAHRWWPFARLVDETVVRAKLARLRGDNDAARVFLDVAETSGDTQRGIQLERRLLGVQNGTDVVSPDTLSELLLRDPEDGLEIFEAFVVSHAASGNFDQALGVLNLWADAQPGSAIVAMHRGELLMALDLYEDAVAAFTESLARDARVLRSRIGLTEALVEMKSPDEALRQARLVLAEDPTNIVILNAAAELLDRRDGVGDEERERLLRSVLEIDSGNYDATLGLGGLLNDQQRFQEAFDCLIKIEPTNRLDASLNYGLAQAATGLARQADATKYLDQHFASKSELDRLVKMKRSQPDGELSLDDERALALGFMKYDWKSAGPHLMRSRQGLPQNAELIRAAKKFARQMK